MEPHSVLHIIIIITSQFDFIENYVGKFYYLARELKASGFNGKQNDDTRILLLNYYI